MFKHFEQVILRTPQEFIIVINTGSLNIVSPIGKTVSMNYTLEEMALWMKERKILKEFFLPSKTVQQIEELLAKEAKARTWTSKSRKQEKIESCLAEIRNILSRIEPFQIFVGPVEYVSIHGIYLSFREFILFIENVVKRDDVDLLKYKIENGVIKTPKGKSIPITPGVVRSIIDFYLNNRTTIDNGVSPNTIENLQDIIDEVLG